MCASSEYLLAVWWTEKRSAAPAMMSPCKLMQSFGVAKSRLNRAICRRITAWTAAITHRLRLMEYTLGPMYYDVRCTDGATSHILPTQT